MKSGCLATAGLACVMILTGTPAFAATFSNTKTGETLEGTLITRTEKDGKPILFVRLTKDSTRELPAEEWRQEPPKEREALIDLLVWTMFVDRHVAIPEQNFVRQTAGGLSWQSARPLEVYLDASVRRIRDLLGSEEAEQAYLEEIAGRLPDPDSRKRALQVCEQLASADGELAPAGRAGLEEPGEELGGEPGVVAQGEIGLVALG